jgi:hypothetical protein
LQEKQKEQEAQRSSMVDSALKQSIVSGRYSSGLAKETPSRRSRRLNSQEASISAFKTNGHDISLGVVGLTAENFEPVVKIANLLRLNEQTTEPIEAQKTFELNQGRNSSLLDISNIATKSPGRNKTAFKQNKDLGIPHNEISR